MNITRKLVHFIGFFALFMALALAVPVAAKAETITELVDTSFAEEDPVWGGLYEAGYGHLDVDQVSAAKKVICAAPGSVPWRVVIGWVADIGFTPAEAEQIAMKVAESMSTYQPAC